MATRVAPIAALLLSVLSTFVCGCGTEAPAEVVAKPGGLVAEPSLLELTADAGSGRRRDVVCRLVNRSDRDVRIVSVETTCACTLAAPLERTTLKPGEAVPLRLTVSMPSEGVKESAVNVAVEPSDVAAPSLRLVLRGPERPLPYLFHMPERLRLAGRRAGEELTQECEVSAIERPGSEPWLRGVVDPAGEVVVRFDPKPVEEPYGRHVLRRYRFTITGRLPETPDAPQPFALALTAEPKAARSGFPVAIQGTWVLEPLARIVPAQLTLRRSEVSAWPVIRRVLVVTERPEDVSVEPPMTLPEWLSLRQVESEAGRLRTFEVEIAEPPAAAGLLSETLPFGLRSESDGGSAADLVITVGP